MSENDKKIVDIITWYSLDNESIFSEWDSLNGLITKVPDEIVSLLSISDDSIVVTSETDFKKLMKDYLIHSIQDSNAAFSYEVIKWMNYLSTLLVEMMRIEKPSDVEDIMANPYYNYWASRGKFKKAWDASVYNYLFRKSKRWVMKPQDHLDFAIRGYHHFFPEKAIAQWIWKILPEIQWINSDNDFFRRWIQWV